MCFPCDEIFSLVHRSRSFVTVKVKYQAHIFFKNNGHYEGVSVSETHVVFTFEPVKWGQKDLTCVFGPTLYHIIH